MEYGKEVNNKGFIKFPLVDSCVSDYSNRSRMIERALTCSRKDCPCFFDIGFDIFLCESQIRIPELGIDGFITWRGSSSRGFGLDQSSQNYLGKGMYISIRKFDGSNIIISAEKWFSYEQLGYDTTDWGGDDDGILYYHLLKSHEHEFTLLDEFQRDFSLNPCLDKYFNISLELENELQQDFANMFINDTLSDLTLQCQDGTLKAHKTILVSRSVFFQKMFSFETVESTKSEVRCDFSTDVMRSILDYIYRNEFDQLKAYALYEAADYYSLTALKVMCEKAMVQGMTLGNMLSVVSLAQSCKDFKIRALRWISWNAKEIKKSREYLELKSSDNCASVDLLQLIDEALDFTLKQSTEKPADRGSWF